MARIDGILGLRGIDFSRLANDIYEFLNLAMLPFRTRTRLPVDLRDLLLFQALSELLREAGNESPLSVGERTILRDRARDLYNEFGKMPSGGAYILYPKVFYAKRRDSVFLAVNRGRASSNVVEEFDKFYVEQFSVRIEARNLKAKILPKDVYTVVEERSPRIQLYPRDLKWKWYLTPQDKGNLRLDFWLERVEESKAMETVFEFFDNYRAVQVAPEVKPELPSVQKFLKMIGANPAFWISVVATVFATWFLHYYGPQT